MPNQLTGIYTKIGSNMLKLQSIAVGTFIQNVN